MDKLKCMACGYVEDDNFAVGDFVEITGLTSDDVAKAVACPVCGTVKVVFNYDYYDPKLNKEEQDLETMRRCKDHGVDYMDIIGKDKNKPNKEENECR